LGARAFAAARTIVGVPFRAQGRDPRYGLDCVGLVWAAYAAVGCALPAPTDYPLRGWRRGRIVAALMTAGFRAVSDRADGDVALIGLSAGQHHLGVIGPASMVHAHAGLRRVVESPSDDVMRAAARWRLEQ
jgi:cell wall-associated NlpC family hydrolase